jgi:hypothetical protein
MANITAMVSTKVKIDSDSLVGLLSLPGFRGPRFDSEICGNLRSRCSRCLQKGGRFSLTRGVGMGESFIRGPNIPEIRIVRICQAGSLTKRGPCTLNINKDGGNRHNFPSSEVDGDTRGRLKRTTVNLNVPRGSASQYRCSSDITAQIK